MSYWSLHLIARKFELADPGLAPVRKLWLTPTLCQRQSRIRFRRSRGKSLPGLLPGRMQTLLQPNG
jgi:hypothetical protein